MSEKVLNKGCILTEHEVGGYKPVTYLFMMRSSQDYIIILNIYRSILCSLIRLRLSLRVLYEMLTVFL